MVISGIPGAGKQVYMSDFAGQEAEETLKLIVCAVVLEF
jgi:hypothetical protein